MVQEEIIMLDLMKVETAQLLDGEIKLNITLGIH